jgi:hypothetical protein
MYAISRKVNRIEIKRRKRKERKENKTKGEERPPFFSHPLRGCEIKKGVQGENNKVEKWGKHHIPTLIQL